MNEEAHPGISGQLSSRMAHANRGVRDKNGYVRHSSCDHIFFIGFLGAGKSTVARNLGQMFNRRHLDTDRMVVHRQNKSVAELFATVGEQGYRQFETRALEELKHEKSCLISCGGGIVEWAPSMELIHSMGTVVFLDIDLDGALSHIVHPETRPDLGDYQQARRLLEHRRPLYLQEADICVDIRGLSFTRVAYTVAERLYNLGLI